MTIGNNRGVDQGRYGRVLTTRVRGAFDGTKAIEISEGETKIYWIDVLAGKILVAIELQLLYDLFIKTV